VATSTLAQSLGDLDEAAVLSGVDDELAAGVPGLAILEELQQGMELVGERFASGEYYLSELIYAADIFKKVNGLLGVTLQQAADNRIATIVLGTVKNDLHDFGKDIVGTVLSSNGIEVIDLGVNVEYQAFVDAIDQHQPRFVGMSCLLTTVFDDMKHSIDAIAAAGLRDRVTILIGGGPVDQAVCDYVGADVYCESAQDAVNAAKRALGID
jgi:dimethylamine corrinoid protein